MNIYDECPVTETDSFTLRLVDIADSEALFKCYNDARAVRLMNDDNCDFGFFTKNKEKMTKCVFYWIRFYESRDFVRFAIVNRTTGAAVGTVEGFNGETGVLRVDIAAEYEKEKYLSELLGFARNNFYGFFGNEYLVIKAMPDASERRAALERGGWEFIDKYKEYHDYYRTKTLKR